MNKCKHSRTELIYVSRKHETVQEITEDLWNDYLVGIKCRDCPEEMPMSVEMLITKYSYRGKPHYAVTEKSSISHKLVEFMDREVEESKTELAKLRKKQKDASWFPGDCYD